MWKALLEHHLRETQYCASLGDQDFGVNTNLQSYSF